MNEMPEMLQNILIILLAFIIGMDAVGFQVLGTLVPIFIGVITGDMTTALIISGTFGLMGLGLASIGGASIPDYTLATLAGGFIAIRSGEGLETAIAIGVPVGLLAVQLDIIVKLLINFVSKKSQTLANQGKFKQMNNALYAGPVLYGLKFAVPVAFVVLFGSAFVKNVLNILPQWFMDGLSIAGGLLPAVGIAILLHYMPTKKYLGFLIVGYVLAGYLQLPVLGVALVGLGFAYTMFVLKGDNKAVPATADGTPQMDELGDDFDE